jgi:hypothetical protein
MSGKGSASNRKGRLLRLAVRGRSFTVAERPGVHPIDPITRAAVRLLPARPGIA